MSTAFPTPFPQHCPPLWASGWGQDGYGYFVEFTCRGVVQRMRWIPAGRFVMGSPVGEAERMDREGPQHEVTFAQGFWIFATACSQALWQAVMGENPSRFPGEERPVETVSFTDVQRFLDQIEQLLPGLQLTLPSEAQWEYACRAGTSTPFSFGNTISPQQVNFNGNYPYPGGEKGEHRKQTVPLASLPPNPWGLFEMHGNVWEWCQDHEHRSYQGAPKDGSAWLNSAAPADAWRVVRGGSWYDLARSVRSAIRYWYVPAYRGGYLGFRCVRVP
ncbi:MAG: formylglycine-generating enzyme family protein [Magnetococcales bacterium]|nr:formylglycine-generating enzyme family protein [Magnetococcales bacterium]